MLGYCLSVPVHRRAQLLNFVVTSGASWVVFTPLAVVVSCFPYFFLAIALASALHLSSVMRSHSFTCMSLPVPLNSWLLCWVMLGRRLWNWWKVDVLKHSSFNDGDLSPSLISDSSVLSSFKYQAVAVAGSVLLVSSGRCWICLSVLEWNCKWSDEALDV